MFFEGSNKSEAGREREDTRLKKAGIGSLAGVLDHRNRESASMAGVVVIVDRLL